jgi:hypothetical protein
MKDSVITKFVFVWIKKYFVSSCMYWKEVHLLGLEVDTTVIVTHCFYMCSSIWCQCEHWFNELASLAKVKIAAFLLFITSVVACVVYNIWFMHILWSPCYNALKIEPVIESCVVMEDNGEMDGVVPCRIEQHIMEAYGEWRCRSMHSWSLH